MLAIYKKEIRSYFRGIIGWLYLFFFFAISGIYCFVYNILYGYSQIEYVFAGIGMLVILLLPIITMRVMAEENRQKTDQLLFTSGVKVEAVMTGKFLAAFTLIAIPMVVFSFLPLIYSIFGVVNFASAYSAILGFFLLLCAYTAIGCFISTVTENQAFSAIITFAVIILSMLSNSIGGLFSTSARTTFIGFMLLAIVVAWILFNMMNNWVVCGGFFAVCAAVLFAIYKISPALLEGKIKVLFSALSVVDRFDTFTYGIFDISSILYYLSIIGIFWFLSVQAIKKRRWN